MTQLTPDNLADKNDPNIQKILSIGFEYLLCGVVGSYCESKKITSMEDFNKKNRLIKPVLLSYPFFVALANGHSESLYNLFGPFYTFTYGPASSSISDLIDSNEDGGNPHRLKYFQMNEIHVDILDAPKYNGEYSNLRNAILEEPLPTSDGISFKFKDIAIEKDIVEEETENGNHNYTPLFVAIDNGINILNKLSNKLFFDGNLRHVMDLANHFKIKSKKFQTNKIEVINYQDIDSPWQNEIPKNQRKLIY